MPTRIGQQESEYVATRRKGAGGATRGAVVVEHLEARRFMSATLQVENLDVVPGFERMIFNRIRNPNLEEPNYVKDRGTLRLRNAGDQTLRFSGVEIDGPFRILGLPPMAIPQGKAVTLTVEFTATRPPPFTYNQTNASTNSRDAGAYIGSMTFRTNDPANATFVEGLAGWFQNDSERNQEPNLQATINLISDYATNIADGRVVTLPQGPSPTYYGEEERDGQYWRAANPGQDVFVRQLSKFRSQGDVTNFGYFVRSGSPVAQTVLRSGRLAGQSFLPYREGQPGVAATARFNVGSNVIGFKIDSEWSDDGLNANRNGGGHTVRFYPARDHFGNILANTYFAAMDYSVDLQSQNFDFQDNVFIISNVTPAGN